MCIDLGPLTTPLQEPTMSPDVKKNEGTFNIARTILDPVVDMVNSKIVHSARLYL